VTDDLRVKPIIKAGGKQFYRVGPIYCDEVRGGVAISYEVDDVADWERKRAEAIRIATSNE
jgi:hypothetical protein